VYKTMKVEFLGSDTKKEKGGHGHGHAHGHVRSYARCLIFLR